MSELHIYRWVCYQLSVLNLLMRRGAGKGERGAVEHMIQAGIVCMEQVWKGSLGIRAGHHNEEGL